MSSGKKVACLAGAAVHFLLILAASSRDTFSILAEGGNVLSESADRWCDEAASVASEAIGERLSFKNPLRQLLAAYVHSAGVDSGYAFFAPNVPNSYKLVFELTYPNGKVDYLLPKVGSQATGFRLVSLFDTLGRTTYLPLRELMLQMLAYGAWRDHRDATNVRAVFGIVELPTADEFAKGQENSYQFLYAYDFHFGK